MTRVRFALVFAALSAPDVCAQSPFATTPPTPVPVVTALLPYIHDEGLAKELLLTSEQVSRLMAYRQKQWDEAYITVPAEHAKGAAERTKATVAILKEVLTADQYKQAVQLAVHNRWVWSSRDRAGHPDTSQIRAATLAEFPEIAEALNLTDDQKRLVTDIPARNIIAVGPMVFLTPEQSKAAKALLGPPANSRWKMATDPRARLSLGGGSFGTGTLPVPRLVSMTGARDVRVEIGLTDEQDKALEPIRAKWLAVKIDARNSSPESRVKKYDELRAEMDGDLTKVLKPEQFARLHQIDRQQYGSEGSSWFDGVIYPLTEGIRVVKTAQTSPLSPDQAKAIAVAGRALTFTPEQAKALAAADKALVEVVRAAVTSDRPADVELTAIMAAREAREAACAAILTPAQKQALDDLFGKPFMGGTNPDRPGGGVGRSPETLRATRAATFGRYTTELRLLATNKTIQVELALTPDQIRKATAADRDYLAKFGEAPPSRGDPEAMAKAYAERSDFTGKALADILTPGQAERFRQLMLQSADQFLARNRGGSAFGPAGYPGVATAIKLTDDQKAKLLDGNHPGVVLTAGQNSAIEVLMGRPFTGHFRVAPVGGVRSSRRPRPRSSRPYRGTCSSSPRSRFPSSSPWSTVTNWTWLPPRSILRSKVPRSWR